MRLTSRQAIQQILALHAEGLNPTAIARKLTNEQVPTAHGLRPWSQSTVSQIIAQQARREAAADELFARFAEAERYR
ncbi:recombinase family protein [Rhodococcus sp. NPDC058521]|uniref:recombinase family protein n=1 Tax=Rhodococcus sp. NPDC058521 TaxID=3346536 RepID=UPI003648A4DB